ncbi:MAG TPA: LytTR family transcriptional regulator [Candidatus Paraprevotella stercorigallinarum]|nr:LytTR family transcriptional regulator [Candidatus Paraprevotella stercorigallinarum]
MLPVGRNCRYFRNLCQTGQNFFSENKLTYACTFQGKHLIVDKTLSQLEDELDPSRFFRVNRQFVLSVDAIKRLEPYFNNKYRIYIFPEFQGEIYVSREKITLLKNWLDY